MAGEGHAALGPWCVGRGCEDLLFGRRGQTLYGLTPAGLRALNALNSIKEVEEFTPVVAAKRERFIPQGVYTGEAPLFTRPGALDFLSCPSRVGNRLIYKENTDVRKTVTLA